MGEASSKALDGGEQGRSKRWRLSLLLVAAILSFLTGLSGLGDQSNKAKHHD